MSLPCVHIAHIFVIELGLDFVTLDIFGPLSPLFDQSTGKYTLLPQLNDALEYTKPAV